MYNLYFSTQSQPTSGDFPDQEKQKLLSYKSTLQGIRDQVTPDNDLLAIDEKILNVLLGDLRLVSSELNQIRNNSGSQMIDGVNRIYKLLTKAINQLNVAMMILQEKEKAVLTRQVRTDYFECFNDCESYLTEILQEFIDMQL